AAYERRFSGPFRASHPAPAFASWLSPWRALVGACRDPRVLTLRNSRSGTLELACDRGGLRIDLAVVPGADGTIASLNLHGATGLDPAPELSRAGERALKLLARWNEREFRGLFTADADGEAIRRVLADAALKYGRCRLGPPHLVGLRAAGFALECERGAPYLDVGNSEIEPAKLRWIELREEHRGPCR
ncbi:MAG: hypothetical protein KC420_13240, partial [Myxococcales bacterium]|nr:hypothetical protein [Myxococcales bacterium]